MTDSEKIIISCEACETSYSVQRNDIYASGRPVRCTKCNYEWLATPTLNKITTQNITITERPSSQQDTKMDRLKNALYFIIPFLALFVLITAWNYNQDNKNAIDLANIKTKNLYIKDISYRIEKNHDNISETLAMIVLISIQNQSKGEILLETIDVIGIDKDNVNTAESHVSPHTKIEAGNSINISVKLPITNHLIPKYVNVVLNNHKIQGRDIFNLSDKTITVSEPSTKTE
jgi:predicted Zn finger-like uncharacterized protein